MSDYINTAKDALAKMNTDDDGKYIYWAADDAQTLASSALTRAKSFYSVLAANAYLDQLRRNWMFYHGQFYSGMSADAHRINFGGEMGELTQLPVNHFRNFAEHMINMITANRPSMEAKAVNSDYKSLAQTYLANGILDYYMRVKGVEECIYNATQMAVVMGSGFIRLEWNATGGDLYDFDPESGEKNYEGELEFSNLSPYDVVFDGTKEVYDPEWVLVRSFQNRFNIAAKYPELRDKILSVPTKGSVLNRYRLSIFSNDDTDDIPVYEFYHERTEALPNGRYLLFVSEDVQLLDMPLPYREIPIYRISAGEYMGTPYGYTPMFDLFPIQESINSLYSTLMTNNSAFGVQNLFVQRGSDLDINSLEGALNILEGNSKPEPIQLTASAPETYKFLQMLESVMETISGINSVTRGNPEASLKSGAALALVQSMAIQFMSRLQNNYVKLVENIGTSLINILKDYAKTPKTIALVGQNKRQYLKEFTSDKIDAIDRVIVTVGNPLARTTAGRVQMAEQLLQMGLLKNPKDYLSVINTGTLDGAFEGIMDERLYIRLENEYMMEGKDVMVDITDTHAEHILEHRTLMFDPDLRLNPTLRQIVQTHIQTHIDMLRNVDPDLLMLLGQQPLQNANMGQMPPPMQAPNDGGMSAPPGMMGGDMASGDMAQQMQNGAGFDPSQFMQGQGTQGGNMSEPQVPTPPPPFQNLPTNPSQNIPQG